MNSASGGTLGESELCPGLLISSNVRLEQLLARGGGGAVWTATHLALGTRVAVKFLAHAAIDEEAIARFTREATLAAQIRSPHAVQIFDYGTTASGLPFIVMELLDGE